ncbi:hypothetical protein BHE74_00040373 [Ensete ventricosum]|nr:hypothetical protein BHE74_00040373 [Ensete ventricosum]RZS19861.1 hypothetical protein BHM03_00052306 [Ensete ventricosum]
MRSSFSCITTVASAPTSSGTFHTPTAANDDFYTCSPTLSLLSIDHPIHSSISSAEVNRRQTFTVVDNIVVSFLQVHWPLRWLLHLLACAVRLVASTALVSLPRVPVRATAHCLSVLCREGAISSFSLSNDSKFMTATLLSLPFRSIDRPSRSNISSAEVNRHQTFTVVDNIAVSFLQVHWPLFKIRVLHMSLILRGHDMHTAQAGGGPAQITDATITVDDGVEDDDVGIAAESGESDVHESLGEPAATVPSDEGDSGIEGRNVGVESTEAGVV